MKPSLEIRSAHVSGVPEDPTQVSGDTHLALDLASLRWMGNDSLAGVASIICMMELSYHFKVPPRKASVSGGGQSKRVKLRTAVLELALDGGWGAALKADGMASARRRISPPND